MRSVRYRNKISLFFSDPCEIITLIFNASKLNYIPTFIVDGHKKHKKKKSFIFHSLICTHRCW